MPCLITVCVCVVCSPPGSLGSAVTLSPGLGPASGVVTSGEVLRMAGDEADLEEDLSGTQAEESTHDSGDYNHPLSF